MSLNVNVYFLFLTLENIVVHGAHIWQRVTVHTVVLEVNVWSKSGTQLFSPYTVYSLSLI